MIGIVVLQKCMDLLGSVLSSCREACAASRHEGSEVTCGAGEEVSDIKQEKDKDPLMSAAVKLEPEVSCIYVEC